jgi:ribosomal protein S18 acetylase RimI-like enzyme
LPASTRIRQATQADHDLLLELWRTFAEGPSPPWATDAEEDATRDIARALAEGVALIAEEDGIPAGFAFGFFRRRHVAWLTDLWVRPESRRRGIATALIREFSSAMRERGARFVILEVGVENRPARSLYAGLGFRDHLLELVADVDQVLAERPQGRSFGSIHIQSDNTPAVERAVRQFVPRLPGRSRGSLVVPPRNGWVSVYDDVCDRDPKQLRRLARELSDRMGAVALALGVEEGAVARFILYDRGGIVDEYLSIQEYYGPLPPGDVIALAANPTVVSRLTGADAGAVRAAAVHGASPAALPPPEQTLAELGRVMGIAGADYGYADAPELPEATRIERP